VAMRLERQRILDRPVGAPQVEVVLNEAAILRADPGQVKHLAKMANHPAVTIRVLPLSVGLHRGMMASGGFTIMEFPPDGAGRPTEPTTVFCADGLTGALYLDRPEEIKVYEFIWDGL
jgi:hypothetical protein